MHAFQYIRLEIEGVGFILYSPHAVAHIPTGADYLAQRFGDPNVVEAEAVAGGLVGVCTSSPGAYVLAFGWGYPADDEAAQYEFRLRLGIRVTGGGVFFRDLYDLLSWSPACPERQRIGLADGFYHVTLLSSVPPSGILGDAQDVLCYFAKTEVMPRLRYNGVPTLC